MNSAEKPWTLNDSEAVWPAAGPGRPGSCGGENEVAAVAARAVGWGRWGAAQMSN